MKSLAEVSELDSLYYFLNQSIRQLQQLHIKGLSHGGIEPLTLSIDPPYELVEGSMDAIYASPEIAIGLAIVEEYSIADAVRIWKQKSVAMRWIERWIPAIAEEYSTHALQKLVGTPIPEQQSDIWSLGISYLSIFDTLYRPDHSFPEKELFFEVLSRMLRLRGRTLPSVETAETAETSAETAETALPVVRHSGRLMLTEPIRRGERNKTRRNPHN